MSLGQVSRILKELAVILISWASHSALNGVEFGQSAPIVNIDITKKNSVKLDHSIIINVRIIIKSDKMIIW